MKRYSFLVSLIVFGSIGLSDLLPFGSADAVMSRTVFVAQNDLSCTDSQTDSSTSHSAITPYCSIAAAMSDLNAEIEAGTVTVRPTLSIGSGTYVELLQIEHDMDVVGTSTVIDGQYNSTIRRRNLVIATGAQVTATGLTLRRGQNNGKGGGVNICRECSLSLSNTLIMSASAGTWGGGIYNEGNLSLEDVAIRDSNAVHGGALYNSGGSISGTNVSIRDNTVTGSGGGIYNGFGPNNSAAGPIILRESMIRNNVTTLSGGGGGVFLDESAPLELVSVTLNNNSASDGNGGGILAKAGSLLRISNSSIYNNTAKNYGGGLYLRRMAEIYNSSIDSNQSETMTGGGVYAVGIGGSASLPVAIHNSSITRNRAANGGAGVFLDSSGDVRLSNSLLALNIQNDGTPADCLGPAKSRGYNFIQHNSCGMILDPTIGPARGDILTAGTDPLLGTFTFHGALTKSYSLQAGSPLVDAGNPTGCRDINNELFAAKTPPPENLSQNSVERALDGDGDGSARCDIGAFEAPVMLASLPLPLGTTTTTTTHQTKPQLTVKSLVVNARSDLVTAINQANQRSGADTISIEVDAGVKGVIDASQLPVISDSLTINGPGADKMTLLSAGRGSVLKVDSAGQRINVIISGLTVSGGAAADCGGGISISTGDRVAINNVIVTENSARQGGGICNEGDLTLRQSTVSSNQALSTGGGGIYNSANLSIDRSNLSRNEAASNGGGIFTTSESKLIGGRSETSITLSNSTINQNSAAGAGGALYIERTGQEITLVHVSLIDNTATGSKGKGAEIYNEGGQLSMSNSLVSSQESTQDINSVCSGALSSEGGNYFQETRDCQLRTHASDLALRRPGGLLAAFSEQRAVPGSGHYPLMARAFIIDRGYDLACSQKDQIGTLRTASGSTVSRKCDIGAIESVAADGLAPLDGFVLDGRAGPMVPSGSLGGDDTREPSTDRSGLIDLLGSIDIIRTHPADDSSSGDSSSGETHPPLDATIYHNPEPTVMTDVIVPIPTGEEAAGTPTSSGSDATSPEASADSGTVPVAEESSGSISGEGEPEEGPGMEAETGTVSIPSGAGTGSTADDADVIAGNEVVTGAQGTETGESEMAVTARGGAMGLLSCQLNGSVNVLDTFASVLLGLIMSLWVMIRAHTRKY